MTLRRWLQKFASPRASRPTSAPLLTALPMCARIVSYDPADEVGSLQLADGSALRFGRSACRGFEPLVAAAVILHQVRSTSAGSRAARLTLDLEDDGYDELLAARDAALGAPPLTMTPSEAAATARALGLITVLLREPLPGGSPLRRWARDVALGEGITAAVERDLVFRVDRSAIQTYPGRAAFPTDGLDLSMMGAEPDLGRSFLGLGAGLPGMSRSERAARLVTGPAWAPERPLHQLSRLVRGLAPLATGVVLHRARDLVLPIAEWSRRLGDLEGPDFPAHRAWLDAVVTRDAEGADLLSIGMDAFGLPDVFVPLQDERPPTLARARRALFHLTDAMVQGVEAQHGQEIHVPAPEDGGEPAAIYRVQQAGEHLMLAPIG